MPKLSIITPSYNHGRFLEARVSSILGQTFRDFEWIVIDDCSSDGSQEELQRLLAREPKVRIILHDRNQGMGATVNEAINASSGIYVHRAESDDFCKPRLLETLVAVLDSCREVGFVHGKTHNLDESGRSWPELRRRGHDKVMDGKQAFVGFALENTVAGPTTLARRDVIEQVGGFAVAPGRIACDWHFALRASLIHDIGYVAAPLGYHRLHSHNFSSAPEALLWERYEIIGDVFERLPPEREDLRPLLPDARRAISHRAGAGVYVHHLARGHWERAAAAGREIERLDPGATNGRAWLRACTRSSIAQMVQGTYPYLAQRLLGNHLQDATARLTGCSGDGKPAR